MKLTSVTGISIYPILFILFWIDLSQFFLFETQYAYLILCFYCTVLFFKPTLQLLCLAAIFFSLESFANYGQFGLPLFYLTPITAIGFILRHNVYINHLHMLILMIASLLIQILLLEGYWLGFSNTISCTIGKIIANIVITSCFSLTLSAWGMQDNRS